MSGPLSGRPRLIAAVLVGVAVAIALFAIPNALSGSTRAIFAWDAAGVVFLGSIMQMMSRFHADTIKRHAIKQDEGRGLILGLSILAACASVMAIGLELSLAKDEHGLLKGLRILLAFVTIAISWMFVHVIFALHYAHEYYAADPTETAPEDDGLRGGLHFPGDEPPDYWDFLHFALVIGLACQTADIEFTSKTQRRIGTLHGLVAFVFNTVVLALTINLMAGLF